jgi:arsenate reductase
MIDVVHLPQSRPRNVAQYARPHSQCRDRASPYSVSKTAPTRAMLKSLLARTGTSVRSILREKDTPFVKLGLGDLSLADDALLDAIETHPILASRPIVVTPWGVRRCRPSEKILEVLPRSQLGEFRKEDGHLVVDPGAEAVA